MHQLKPFEITHVTGGAILSEVNDDVIKLTQNCKDKEISDPLQCPGLCELVKKGKHLTINDPLGSISFSINVFEDPYLKICASAIDRE